LEGAASNSIFGVVFLMAHLLGSLTGAFMLLGILILVISQFAFKRDIPKRRAGKTVLTATVIAVVLSLFGAGFDLMFQGFYVLAGIVMFPIMLRHYSKHWIDDDPGDVFR